MALKKKLANQLRGNDLRWTAEEGVGQGWDVTLHPSAQPSDHS